MCRCRRTSARRHATITRVVTRRSTRLPAAPSPHPRPAFISAGYSRRAGRVASSRATSRSMWIRYLPARALDRIEDHGSIPRTTRSPPRPRTPQPLAGRATGPSSRSARRRPARSRPCPRGPTGDAFAAGHGETVALHQSGHPFQVVDGLLTNFHLPVVAADAGSRVCRAGAGPGRVRGSHRRALPLLQLRGRHARRLTGALCLPDPGSVARGRPRAPRRSHPTPTRKNRGVGGPGSQARRWRAWILRLPLASACAWRAAPVCLTPASALPPALAAWRFADKQASHMQFSVRRVQSLRRSARIRSPRGRARPTPSSSASPAGPTGRSDA